VVKSWRQVEKFARRHKKALGWGAGGAAAATLLYVVTRSKPKPTLAQLIMAAPQAANVPYLSSVKGMIELQDVTTRLTAMLHTMEYGSPILIDEKTFRTIYTHQGVRALNLIVSAFYNKEGLTFDELKSHAHCQTWNAQVVQLGNDWEGWFYNQVWRGPNIVSANGAQYAGNPLDPKSEAFELAVRNEMGASIRSALKKADLGGALKGLSALLGPTFVQLFGGALPDIRDQYVLDVPPWTRDLLANFGRDMAAKNGTPLPTTQDGQAIPQPMLTMVHASVGAKMVGAVIEMFESHNPKINPCIQELNFDLILSMLLAVLAVFLTVASLGTAGAFGAAISAISFVYKITDSINGLAKLSK